MFKFIKDKIKKVYSSVTKQVSTIFSQNKLDEKFLRELKILLISADTGITTTNKIIAQLTDDIKNTRLTTLDQAKRELERLLIKELTIETKTNNMPQVLLIVGINGSGKTTFIGKLANKIKLKGKKVLLVAGDTFRAAATQQLEEWANRIGVQIFIGTENQDPASVIFDACQKFKDEHFDHILIDTAGRLQTKVNLMNELEKIGRIVSKQLPNHETQTWLTIDAMLGQNSLIQAEVFHEATKINGLVLTKLDGTGKGGIVFAITQKLTIPIIYMTFGESLNDIKDFDPQEYVTDLLNE